MNGAFLQKKKVMKQLLFVVGVYLTSGIWYLTSIQQYEYSKLFYELLIKKQAIKKRLEDIEKYIYLMR